MRFVYVMDPMERVLPDKDTTFAFMRAAQGRGHESLHCFAARPLRRAAATCTRACAT